MLLRLLLKHAKLCNSLRWGKHCVFKDFPFSYYKVCPHLPTNQFSVCHPVVGEKLDEEKLCLYSIRRYLNKIKSETHYHFACKFTFWGEILFRFSLLSQHVTSKLVKLFERNLFSSLWWWVSIGVEIFRGCYGYDVMWIILFSFHFLLKLCSAYSSRNHSTMNIQKS